MIEEKKLTYYLDDKGDCWMIKNIPMDRVKSTVDGEGNITWDIDLGIKKVTE